ncbi:MAG: site-2 protease family protein [Campylobacteraceae bacterium 4484_4]|nr:MAG: site-2 protease family protein [Campylobacteraceae bacterium 4484_4]
MQIAQIIEIVSIVLALMVAIIGHEIMHGRVAYHYGDDTAKSLGRLSINPLVHIDPIGTILVPALLYFSNAGFLFGWAKPVPINMQTVIRNGGYNGAIAVSLAGIAYNFALAVAASLLLRFIGKPESFSILFLDAFLTYTLIYNIVLGVFNLLPIPPLDGSNALMFYFHKIGLHDAAKAIQALSRYGMILLILIIATPLAGLIFIPMQYLINLLLP